MVSPLETAPKSIILDVLSKKTGEEISSSICCIFDQGSFALTWALFPLHDKKKEAEVIKSIFRKIFKSFSKTLLNEKTKIFMIIIENSLINSIL
jgi:hypothetical protein